jgi:hypothetical protein
MDDGQSKNNELVNMVQQNAHNPWVVDTLEDFLFFCCPECPEQSATKDLFINHALFNHPMVITNSYCLLEHSGHFVVFRLCIWSSVNIEVLRDSYSF